MLVLSQAARAETQVKNSRFLAEALPVSSPEEARDLWRFRKEHYDNGGHVVYAFAVGANRNIAGCSDDGEPAGTAGRPVLAVLKGSTITNCLITVARWFGGTKLGVGGLVRAYSEAAKAVLAEAECVELQMWRALELIVPYSLYEQVKHRIAAFGFVVENEVFADEIVIRGNLPAVAVQESLAAMDELAYGKIKVRISEDE